MEQKEMDSLDKVFVIISVSDRINELNGLVKTILSSEYTKEKGYRIVLMYQDYLGNKDLIENKDQFDRIVVADQKLGCHGARVELLKRIKADVYINLDDDMVLGRETNYPPAIEKCLEKDIGFVLTNWGRNRAEIEKKKPKVKHEFKKQIMLYQGGGMIYSEKIAKLMRELEPIKTTFDNAWAITSYVNGYTNLRYQGSLTEHRILGAGGMQSFMAENVARLMNTDLLDFKRAKIQRGNGLDILIPLDKDVKKKAHDLHKQNKK